MKGWKHGILWLAQSVCYGERHGLLLWVLLWRLSWDGDAHRQGADSAALCEQPWVSPEILEGQCFTTYLDFLTSFLILLASDSQHPKKKIPRFPEFFWQWRKGVIARSSCGNTMVSLNIFPSTSFVQIYSRSFLDQVFILGAERWDRHLGKEET